MLIPNADPTLDHSQTIPSCAIEFRVDPDLWNGHNIAERPELHGGRVADTSEYRTADGSDDCLDAKLCFDVYATNLAFARVYVPLLEPHGLTYPQYLVLTLLWERNDRSMREIGDVLQLRSNTLTPILKRMAAAALVERRRAPDDERQVRIRLTDMGRDMRHRLRDVPDCVEQATGLTAPELRELQDRLRKVRAHLLRLRSA